MNVVPHPGWLSTSIRSPNDVTTLCTMGRPRPVPRPGSLVEKYGIEQPLAGPRVHAHAVVAHAKSRAWSPAGAGRVDAELDVSAFTDRVHGVGDEVGHDLMHLGGGGVHQRRGVVVQLETHPGWQREPRQLQHLPRGRHEIERMAFGPHAAPEGEDALHEVPGPMHRALRVMQGGVVVAAWRKRPAHRLHVGEHRYQQVVEVACDAAGQRAQCFVVPGFAQPSFGAGAGPIFGFE